MPGSPCSSAISATVRPTYDDSAGLRTPLIWMVRQSVTQPWQPSVPTWSSSWAIRARSAGSAIRPSRASGPPVVDQLGRTALSVVAPGR